MTDARFTPLASYQPYSHEEMVRRAVSFRESMQHRRSVRRFSSKQIPCEVIENCLLTAGSAPSGANKQPWHFVAVRDAAMKCQIRQAAEKEEYDFYHGRAGDEWLGALSCLGTNHEKPFLEEAPYLIVIFGQSWGMLDHGKKATHYYVSHSVGIATGLLLAAIHNAGLVSLPYTPTRMGFLTNLLGREENERPFLVLAVGYPAEGVMVPAIKRKGLDEIATFI
ncbi:nitroreductase family protein [Planctomycetota bacterium]